MLQFQLRRLLCSMKACQLLTEDITVEQAVMD